MPRDATWPSRSSWWAVPVPTALRRGDFLRSFHDKGRFRMLLRPVPVRVATNLSAPVLGAAYRAAGLL